MAEQDISARGKKAWTVQWRNFQGRKNKSWEYDGYMLVVGLGVTVHSDEGKLLGAKNLSKPPHEDDEFSISNSKEVRVGDEISLKEYYRNVLPGGAASEPSDTPAKAPPGFFTRPVMLASTSTPRHHTPRPSTTRGASPSVSVSAPLDTPDSAAGKHWVQPRDKPYKPFKPLTASATKRSPSVGPGGAAASGGMTTPGPSRLRESSVDADRAGGTGVPARERRLEELRTARAGKARVRSDQADESGEEVENSPPKHREEGSAPKKRRLDSATTAASPLPQAPARSASRLSAADAAFERALGNSSKTGVRATSVPDRVPAPAKPLFRSDASAVPPARAPDQRSDADDEDDDALISADDMEMEVDLDVFGAHDGAAWSGEDGVEEARPKVPVRASGGTAVGASQPEGDKRRFACQWRKRTQKKHPVWEDDGVLAVRGSRAELEDKDTGKRLGSTTLMGGAKLDDGDILRVGDMEVEIGEELIVRTSTKTAYSQGSSQLSLVQPTSLAIKPFRAPAPSKAVNPLAARVASRSPERARSASRPPTSGTAQSALPSGAAKFKMPGLASMSVVSSSAAYGVKESKKSQRFDPSAEGAIVMRRPDAEHQKTYNKRGLPIVDVVVDPLIGGKLRDHQKEGVAFMYECVMGMRTAGQGCLLADDMGLGKTIQSIALIWTLLKQNPYHGGSAGVIDRVMIVCPVTLIKNWGAEIKKWLGRDKLRVYIADAKHPVSTFARNKSYDVLIVGYDKVRAYIDDVKYAQPPIGLIICDEGHRLKSEKAKTTQALQSLSCMRRVILSGTPIQNNLGEFFAMMDFVNPGLLNDAAYFKKNFEQPILASRQPRATAKEKEAGKDASESLFAIQRNFVLRRTNEIILKHLPPKLEFTVFIRPTKLQLDLYREVLSSSLVRSMLEGFDRKQGLPLLQSVLKLSTSPGLVMKHIKDNGLGHLDESILDVLPKDGDAADFTLSGKFAVLGSLLSELRANSEEKVVVVSNFTSTLDLIETHCKRKKYPYCRLDGKTPQMDRIPMVEAFNRGSHKNQFVFLLSSKGGGTGLNIIGASRLVQVDSDWNPSNDLQAMARIHREGQKRTCVIYRFLTAGMVDEVIFQRQIIKLALSGSIMDQDGAAAAKSKDAFTLDELRNLFTLHESVACQTHELLGCRCHLGEVLDDADDAQDDSESDEEEEMDGFVQASQFQDDDAVRTMSKQRRNLSILKTWSHYDCADEDSIDDIDDALLKSVIWARMARAADDDDGTVSEGKLRLCGGQVGFVFGKKSGPA